MEKHLSTVGYWLGIICAVLAIIARLLLAFDVTPLRIGSSSGLSISYVSFFHGSALFFLMAIASWCRTAKN